ncbi:MAG: hypothetical protein MUE36_09770 [Acidimicrobiales bacterium]|jgi:hypothetical protein|nr:hypothetical protein [Acidimicrobiales bacterium]
MSSYDLSSLPPADAVVALRSFPRRYRSALRPLDDDESVDELAQRLGPDGQSAVELVVDAVRTWALQREALHQIRLAATPLLHAAVVDPAHRTWDASVHESLADALDQVDDHASELADEAARFSANDWTRRGTIAGSGTAGALDVVRAAVRVGRDNLVAAERALDAQRRH